MKKMAGIFFLFTLLMVPYMINSTEVVADSHDGGPGYETATFAGGCFWCMEHPFEALDGVINVISGYSGGEKENPTYEEVSSGRTAYLEAVQIIYDPSIVSYKSLLDVFWQQVDPTDPGGQFADRGSQYHTALFYHSEEQRVTAEKSRKELESSGVFNAAIVTGIIKFSRFYKAEEYHQDYYKKNPIRYKVYRFGSGRDQFLDKVWGESRGAGQHGGKTGSEKRSSNGVEDKSRRLDRLTGVQFDVTQKNGTEPPFNNEFWDNKSEGIYVDIVLGEPLFSSKDKFRSGTGWPSFVKPLEPENIIEKADNVFFMQRTEVRSKKSDSHLGHLFNDGPAPTGLRYCINSAALRFVPRNELAKQGYGRYENLF